MDFSKTLIRCSSLSCLFTEPLKKEDKIAGKLSKTAQTHLVEVYAREIWGVEKDIMTKAMKKGVEAEEDGITLLSRFDKKLYVKNDERKENEWICGHADIVEEDCIVDLKLSYDAFTFLPKLIEDISDAYYYQIQGYMWLWEIGKGRISYGLTNTPESIIQGELFRLFRSMNVISEESPAYKEAAQKLISNMKFDHIPIEQRVIHHYVDRDEEVISQIPEKVKKARRFLQELYEKHQNLVF